MIEWRKAVGGGGEERGMRGCFTLNIVKIKNEIVYIINVWDVTVIFSGTRSHKTGLKDDNTASDTLQVYKLHTDTEQVID